MCHLPAEHGVTGHCDDGNSVRVGAPRRLRQELAVRLYEKKILGFGKARQLAGMTKWEFGELLGQEEISRHYDEEEFNKDLATIEEINSR